ncbi:hypothetical protein PC116_g27600 [Phytophthora cactorum]|nr:hypothetical protein PC116_g27600 [Phytophthora cactorum]
MKAYDSLSRGFLIKALRGYGYPAQFIDAVQAFHTGTTARFLANGYRSRPVAVTSGIRQGYPLAPLLFILALDALYKELDRHLDLKGVRLRSAVGEIEVRSAGYADDTAVYLASVQYVPLLLRLTSTFGADAQS